MAILALQNVWAAPIAQQAYIKASNTGAGDRFGTSVAVSGDTVVVGATGEDSNATGINGNQSNNNALDSGAAYVFNFFNQVALVPDGSGAHFIRFDGIPGRTYRLQRASNVVGPWATIDTQTAPASGLIEYHETNPPPDAAFYRTVTPIFQPASCRLESWHLPGRVRISVRFWSALPLRRFSVARPILDTFPNSTHRLTIPKAGQVSRPSSVAILRRVDTPRRCRDLERPVRLTPHPLTDQNPVIVGLVDRGIVEMDDFDHEQ